MGLTCMCPSQHHSWTHRDEANTSWLFCCLIQQPWHRMLCPKVDPSFPSSRITGGAHCLGWQDLLQLLLVGNCRGVMHQFHLPHKPWGISLVAIFALAALWAQVCGRFVFSYYSDPLPKLSWEIQGRNGECWSYTAHNSARTEGRFMGAGKGMSSAAGLLSLPKFKGSFSNNRDITACFKKSHRNKEPMRNFDNGKR